MMPVTDFLVPEKALDFFVQFYYPTIRHLRQEIEEVILAIREEKSPLLRPPLADYGGQAFSTTFRVVISYEHFLLKGLTDLHKRSQS